MDTAISRTHLCARAPSDITDEDLRASISELSACITVATAQLLKFIAELDRREAWGMDGSVKSCAHWLNWQCGIALGAAREKVRVARALELLPKISAALVKGEISCSKARAMTRIAEQSNEEYLLMIANHGTAAHMVRVVRGVWQVKRINHQQAAQKQFAERSLNWYWDDDGSLVINARLPADAGAVVVKALEAAGDEIFQDRREKNVSAETSIEQTTVAAGAADAIAHVCENFLSNSTHTHRSAERYQVVIDIPNAEIDKAIVKHGPSLSKETVERLCCDASVVAIETDGNGNPLNIGRKQRTVPPALRRALAHRDHGCRFPGCTSYRHVDAHHIHHWAQGGKKKLSNLILLCRHHHRLIHEGGYEVLHEGGGDFDFYTPQGAKIPLVPPVEQPDFDVIDMVRCTGKRVSAETLVPLWSGEKMDLNMAVEGVLSG